MPKFYPCYHWICDKEQMLLSFKVLPANMEDPWQSAVVINYGGRDEGLTAECRCHKLWGKGWCVTVQEKLLHPQDKGTSKEKEGDLRSSAIVPVVLEWVPSRGWIIQTTAQSIGSGKQGMLPDPPECRREPSPVKGEGGAWEAAHHCEHPVWYKKNR